MDTPDFFSDINMTPFVDIVLVLLIIFMITAPMLESDMDVQLPTTQADPSTNRPKAFHICSIQKNGKIQFLKRRFNRVSELKTFLHRSKMKRSNPVFIRADRQVRYGILASVLSVFKMSGIQNVSLVTQYEP